MTQSLPQTDRISSANNPKQKSWYHPIFSPEHGVYIVLFVSFLTGVAAAQNWAITTILAFFCAFFGLQAEHPLVLQIKQRKSFKPRFLIWGGFYSLITLTIAVYLALNNPQLVWIYLGAFVALLIDGISVFQREQKSIFNELVTFAAVCLSTLLAYGATTGTFSLSIIGLWLLNTLFFSSAIFTVKLRKSKHPSLISGIIYHGVATLIIVGIYSLNWLTFSTAIAFGIALLKFSLILWQREWYCTTKIQYVAILETTFSLLFLVITAFSLLPSHLSYH